MKRKPRVIYKPFGTGAVQWPALRARIGPGKRTIYTHERDFVRQKWSGEELRRLRAERGVGNSRRLKLSPCGQCGGRSL